MKEKIDALLVNFLDIQQRAVRIMDKQGNAKILLKR